MSKSAKRRSTHTSGLETKISPVSAAVFRWGYPKWAAPTTADISALSEVHRILDSMPIMPMLNERLATAMAQGELSTIVWDSSTGSVSIESRPLSEIMIPPDGL